MSHYSFIAWRRLIRQRCLLCIISVVIVSACAKNIVPSADSEIKISPIVGFKQNTNVTLVNAQLEKAEKKLVREKNSVRMISANLRQWTDTAMLHLQTGLQKSGALVDIVVPPATDTGVKTIFLKITDINVNEGEYQGIMPVVRPACSVTLHAATKSGFERDYTATEKTLYNSWQSACSDAVKKVVGGLLADAEVVQYLIK